MAGRLRDLALFFFVVFPSAVAVIGFLFGALAAAAENWTLSDGFLYVRIASQLRVCATAMCTTHANAD